MGLDGVELLVEVEDSFDIVIPDEVAVRVETPGNLFVYLLRAGYKAMPQGACLSQSVFYRLRAAILADHSLEKKLIRPRASVPALLPQLPERGHLRRLNQRLALKREVPSWCGLNWTRPGYCSFGELAREFLARNYGVLAEEHGAWNPKEAWYCLRLLIADQLGVGIEKVTRTAHFINDLGMS